MAEKRLSRIIEGIAIAVIAGLILHALTTNPGNSNSAQTSAPVINTSIPTRSVTSAPKAAKDILNPVNLLSLNAYYEGSIEFELNGIKDTMGNSYSSAIRGYASLADVKKYGWNCYCIWDIGGKYKTLEATGIIRSKDKGSKYEGSYKIYGDGKLLYSKDKIGSKTKPYSVKVNISGVTDLKIEMYGNGNVGSNGINSVLADIMLYP